MQTREEPEKNTQQTKQHNISHEQTQSIQNKNSCTLQYVYTNSDPNNTPCFLGHAHLIIINTTTKEPITTSTTFTILTYYDYENNNINNHHITQGCHTLLTLESPSPGTKVKGCGTGPMLGTVKWPHWPGWKLKFFTCLKGGKAPGRWRWLPCQSLLPPTAKVLATCPVELYFPMETQRHDP